MTKKQVDRLIMKYFVGDDYGFPFRYLDGEKGRDIRHYDFRSAMTLYSLVRHYKPTSVLEFGGAQGWTSSIINSALIRNKKPFVFVVSEKEENSKKLMEFLHKETFGEKCPTYIGEITERIKEVPKKLDFVFIDTNHDEELTKWYLENILPRCVKGALVAIHDWPIAETDTGFNIRDPNLWPETKMLLNLYANKKLPLKKLYWNYEEDELTDRGLKMESSFWTYKGGDKYA